jgi:lipoprotein-releasing system ATP-binding protein
VTEALVIIEDLRKSFQHMGRTLDVLRGIDLNIYEREIISIVGPSGAGKSTLLHCIGTLDLPTSGKIRLGKEELTMMGSARLAAIRNRTLGFVFQFHHLLPEFDALENVMMPGLILGKKKRDVQRRASALLEEVGLGHRGTHRPGELSGGEQQRVAIARALLLDPKLVLADEPTGNLDSVNGHEVLDALERLNRERRVAVVLVTHDAEVAGRAARLIRMRDGLVLSDELAASGAGARP